ncbi:hypothetical protein X805_40030 [Sphaerotilus natans subsp. natans DSM 6575]|uniref:Uncharacterized protein n=1 Tax=Sphaerotilus natans subsp. natans DSM 6575 TaxID=1286631 RepID=A0A059KH27_9BURK|nr:hypothetical protein X805_40030 [Sphaerotilus natans subsp. natans DSM 6575]
MGVGRLRRGRGHSSLSAEGRCEVLWRHHAVRRRTGAGMRRRQIAAVRS